MKQLHVQAVIVSYSYKNMTRCISWN